MSKGGVNRLGIVEDVPEAERRGKNIMVSRCLRQSQDKDPGIDCLTWAIFAHRLGSFDPGFDCLIFSLDSGTVHQAHTQAHRERTWETAGGPGAAV